MSGLLRELAHAPERPIPDEGIGKALGPSGRYVINRSLGRGGMGTVYVATDASLHRQVALKVLPDSLAADPERKRRFLREARAAAAVTHNNIAAVYDVGEDAGHLFIAMELVAGETLRGRMVPGLPHDEALRVAKEIAAGLARAHESGVVHRDLKPENVMVTPDGNVKILDFGLAKVLGPGRPVADAEATLSHMTVEGHVIGTPPYMSPEQAEGRAEIDARSDVFSFGTMLYEMLAGVRPFEGKTSLEVLYAVVHGEPTALEAACPGVPAALAGVVARCLKKAPGERYASGRELLAALEPTASAPSRRRGAAFWGALLTVTAAALASGGLLWGRHEHARASTASPGAQASSTPRLGVPITEHPSPKSESKEAIIHYKSALSRLRAGGIGSRFEFGKAVALDPTLAAAQLRLALYGFYYGLPASDRKSRLAIASALSTSLDARDRELLPVAEAFVSDPIDFAVAIAGVRDAAARHPEDAEIAILLYWALTRAGLDGEADAAGEHVLDLDPLATLVIRDRAYRAVKEGKMDQADMLAARCIALSPKATQCHQVRITVDSVFGRCDAELAHAHEFVRVEPESPFSYDALAVALAASHAPIESVERTLDRADREDVNVPTATFFPKGTRTAWLAITRGDFAAADAATLAMTTSTAESTSETEHAYRPMLRIALAEEMGNAAKAVEIAERFAKQVGAWTADAPLEIRAKRVYLLHESGTLSDAAFARELDQLNREDLSLGVADKSAQEQRRQWFDLWYSATPREATRALASFKTPSPSELRGNAFVLGRALYLAGRFDEAIPPLETIAHQCHQAPIDSAAMDNLPGTLDYVHAHLLLGQALEATGKTTEACREFAVVRTSWKDATPRSVTLETAKERSRALACPAPQ